MNRGSLRVDSGRSSSLGPGVRARSRARCGPERDAVRRSRSWPPPAGGFHGSGGRIGRVAGSGPPPPPAPEPPLPGLEFLPQARTVFRVAACGTTGDVPARFDASVVARHCDELGHAYDEYRRGWVDVARPFIAALRPKDLPPSSSTPSGAGISSARWPRSPTPTEITTISLEPAGDIRPIDTLAADRLAHELASTAATSSASSRRPTRAPTTSRRSRRPSSRARLLFDLAALVVHGDEPVSLRYFRLQPDGSLAYVTQADIDAAKQAGERRALFANAELRFRRAGDPPRPCRCCAT